MALEFAAEEWRKSPQRNPETDNLAAPGNLADLAKNSEDAPEDLRKFILNTGEIVRHLTESRLAGEDPRKLAYEFHAKLAEQIIAACEEAKRQTGISKAALSGGVFQNRLLLELVDEGLQKKGLQVLKHSLIPPNDGGIALGQAAYGMAYLNRNTR